MISIHEKVSLFVYVKLSHPNHWTDFDDFVQHINLPQCVKIPQWNLNLIHNRLVR